MREREGAATFTPTATHQYRSASGPPGCECEEALGTHNGGLCALSSGYQTSSHNGSVGNELVQGWRVIKERVFWVGGRGLRGRSHDDAWERERAESHLLLLRHTGDPCIQILIGVLLALLRETPSTLTPRLPPQPQPRPLLETLGTLRSHQSRVDSANNLHFLHFPRVPKRRRAVNLQ